MSRNKSDRAKEAFTKLSREIIKHGDSAKAELKELLFIHKPEVIFKLEPGPDREARAAQLIGEMRILARDLSQVDRGTVKAKSKSSKKKVTLKNKISGFHDGFKYAVGQLPNGKWVAKITKQARQIIPEPGSPPIVDHPRLSSTFDSQENAELTVRRIINTSMIWYAERGRVPKERARKSKTQSVQRRTAGQSAARRQEKVSADESAQRLAEKERRAALRREQKTRGRSRRPADVAGSPGRKYQFIPKKNPSDRFSFLHSDAGALAQGEKAFKKSLEWQEVWKKSFAEDKPNFKALMGSYDAVENARVNFILAEKQDLAKDAGDIKKALRDTFVEILDTCNKELRSKRRANPSKAEHEKLGAKSLERAESSWTKYCESCRVSDLLDTYRHLEIAKKELAQAGDKDGVTIQNNRIKQVRSELLKRCK